ncbi:hypothetical protein ACP70R_007667 [Stipagrostis hirtigluma subsp. patula]
MAISSSPAAVGSGAPEHSTSVLTVEETVGSHVLNVEGYTKTKKLGKDDFLSSCTFAAAGHRWSINYYPCGCMSSTMYPSDPSGGATTFAGKGSSSGCPNFIMREKLEKSLYLWNDSFSVRCDITVLKEIHKTDAATAAAFATRFVVVPPSDMDRDLSHLLVSGEGADVMFEVGGETISAHRNILAARSPVFKAQLLGPMKENTAVCVWIDDMEARVFKAMLDFVYTDSFPYIGQGETMVMAQHLLVAADRFSLERLKLMYEDKLCNCIDTSSVETILALAEQHACHGLKEVCFGFLMSGSNLKEAMATDGFDHLTKSCPSVLKELLAKVIL